MFDSILIAIFTYNEKKNIAAILESACKKFKNILIVDNNSVDNTLQIVEKFPVQYIKHKYNLGKSNSMKTALDFARIKNYKYIAFMDGDGQHLVRDLEKICFKIIEIKNGLVIGYRQNLSNLNLKKRLGTHTLNRLFQFIYKEKILDIQSGLRVFNTDEKKINWNSTGLMHYFADAEITCSAIKNKCAIFQVPIKTIASEEYKGMNILQGLYLMIMLFYWRFN